ncbi:MAG: metallophosphoesterase [Erysipelotrichaceae bacterium]|nr:metallophosphoesterase [Erysipelotrichaceae bacterium]
MKKKKCKIWYLLILIMFITLFFVYSILFNKSFILSYYEIKSGFSENVRIVHLTDLHNYLFGKNNTKLIKQVLDESPDIVVMTGDMINENEEDLSVILSLIRELNKSVPVYYSFGNDETIYEREFQNDLTYQLEEAGAVVLNYNYLDIVVRNQLIRIGGYYGYYRTPHMDTSDQDKRNAMNEFCDSFENTDTFKLLLSHIPTTWLDWNRIDDFPVDLVLCGHYHGGQIRIPFIGGLYAPNVGWLPKYTKGLFIGKSATCVLSAGLGTEGFPPRINNPPEIVIIDLK